MPLAPTASCRAHSRAAAEVYLSRYEFNAWDCSPNPETPMVYYWFRFTWRIRLVR